MQFWVPVHDCKGLKKSQVLLILRACGGQPRARLSHVNFPEDFKELSFERGEVWANKNQDTLQQSHGKEQKQITPGLSDIAAGGFLWPTHTALFLFIAKREVTSNVLVR